MTLCFRGLRTLVATPALALVLLLVAGNAAADPPAPGWSTAEALARAPGPEGAHAVTGARAARSAPAAAVADNFKVLGHHDLGALDTNGDVWAHGNFAYVGTWSIPCSGLGVKVVDVSNLGAPRLIGRLAARPGTSAEDVVVRRVKTQLFRGDLLAVGIQRCGDEQALDTQQFGAEFWDVSDPYRPIRLSEIGLTTGGGGVHELDLFQRGGRVYALLATPFSEWFDPFPGGDARIVDVTNPRAPVQVGEWGAGAHLLSPGPFFGIGSFGAAFGHSIRASEDGRRAYVSYWDLGVLTLDIGDPTNPVLLTRTQYAPDDDGDAHSMTPYEAENGRLLILQNDEDFDPTSPTHILFQGGQGIGQFSPSGPAVWELPGHSLSAPVVVAANDGCDAGDYPVGTSGKIAVVRTPLPFFDPAPAPIPLCLQAQQEAAAAAAGAVAVVHDFVSTATSPQWSDFADPPLKIPVLFTSHATAQGMVAAGRATLQGREPSWGFLRIFDATTGGQVAKFDDAPHVHELPPPMGFWSIHNTEVAGDRAYASWYSNGIVALDLESLDERVPGDPELVGQFVPPAAPSPVPFLSDIPVVWGVAVRSRKVENDGDDRGAKDRGGRDDEGRDDEKRGKIRRPVVFASDMNSGLWIVEPTGEAK